jgi:hypothetical protein
VFSSDKPSREAAKQIGKELAIFAADLKFQSAFESDYLARYHSPVEGETQEQLDQFRIKAAARLVAAHKMYKRVRSFYGEEIRYA